MDQDAPQLWPQQQLLTRDPVPSGNKPSAEQIHTGQPLASHEQALPGSKPDPPASAAENAYLELDDDELIELACASLDPQQDGTAAVEQTSQLLTKPPDSDIQSPSAHTGREATGENLRASRGLSSKPQPFINTAVMPTFDLLASHVLQTFKVKNWSLSYVCQLESVSACVAAVFCMACYAGTATSDEGGANGITKPDPEYSLDDNELLALAATQLDEA